MHVKLSDDVRMFVMLQYCSRVIIPIFSIVNIVRIQIPAFNEFDICLIAI